MFKPKYGNRREFSIDNIYATFFLFFVCVSNITYMSINYMMLFEICLRIAKVIFFEFEICEILNLSFTIRIVFFFF